MYQVIPVLAAIYILSVLEKFFHKKLPSAIDFTFTPLLSVMITGFLTFAIIGPVMMIVSNAIIGASIYLVIAFKMGIFYDIFGKEYVRKIIKKLTFNRVSLK